MLVLALGEQWRLPYPTAERDHATKSWGSFYRSLKNDLDAVLSVSWKMSFVS